MTENLSPVEATERYPELKDRIQSTFIDLLLIIVLMYFFARVIENFEPVPNWIRAGLFALLFVLYEPLCMTLGCTLGNYIKQVRVRQHADTSKRINFFQALIRYPIKVALGWVSFLTIGSDPQRRAIHDMASGSVMLKIS